MGVYGNEPNSKRKSKTAERGTQPKRKLAFGDYRFCRIELTASERDACRDEIAAGEIGLEAMERYVGRGYAVKFSADEKGGGIQVAVTCTDAENGDAGLILTGRGASAIVAWNVFLYKDMVLCDGNSWRQTEHERGGSYQDIG